MIARPGQEGFEQRKQQRHFQRTYQLTTDPTLSVFGEIPLTAVLGQHFEGDDACNREHHGKLPAHADEKDESGRFVGNRPKRIAGHMANHGVRNLVKPVDAVQRQASAYDLRVLLMDLRPVDVEYDREDEDEGPVEVFRASDPNAVHKIHSSL